MSNLNLSVQASESLIRLLNTSKKNTESIVQNLGQVYIIFNESFEIIHFNKAAQSIVEKPVFRLNLKEFFEEGHWNQMLNQINQIETANKVDFELDTINNHGFLWELTNYPVKNKGEGKCYQLIGTDVTNLRKKEKLISELFRIVPLAIIRIGENSLVTPGYSGHTDFLFEQSNLADSDFFELIKSILHEDTETEIVEGLGELQSSLGKDSIEYEIAKVSMPERIQINSKIADKGFRTLKMVAEPLVENEITKGLILVFQEEVLAEKQEPSFNDDLALLLSQIDYNYSTLNTTIEDILVIIKNFSQALKTANALDVKNHAHTLKGNLRMIGLDYTARLIHDLESNFEDTEKSNQYWKEFLKLWNRIYRTFDINSEDLKRSLKNSLNTDILGQINTEIKTIEDTFKKTLQKALHSFENTNDYQGVEILKGKVEQLVEENKKKTNIMVNLLFKSKKFKIHPEISVAISSCAIHFTNNSFAHAFKNDKENCRIEIQVFNHDDSIEMIYSDNGQGIDITQVREGLVNNGYLSQTECDQLADEKIAEKIFLSGLSTNATPDELSGRGVGMSSVYSSIKNANGCVKILEYENGCKFLVKLPKSEYEAKSPEILSDRELKKLLADSLHESVNMGRIPKGFYFFPYFHQYTENLINCRYLALEKNLLVDFLVGIPKKKADRPWSRISERAILNNSMVAHGKNQIRLYSPPSISRERTVNANIYFEGPMAEIEFRTTMEDLKQNYNIHFNKVAKISKADFVAVVNSEAGTTATNIIDVYSDEETILLQIKSFFLFKFQEIES